MVVTADYDIVDIADAAVTEINGQDWAVSFTADSGYLTLAELKDIGSTCVVRVTPETLVDGDTITRAGQSEEWGVSINIAKKVAANTKSDVDALVRLELALRDHFDGLGEIGGATVDGIEFGGGTGLLYQSQLLYQSNIFVGSVSLTLSTR